MITDMSYLEEFTGKDPEKLERYINMYLSNAPEQIESLKQNLVIQNWEAVRRAAHNLLPQLHFMGMDNLKPLVERIETDVLSRKDLELLEEKINQLEKGCQESFVELDAYLRKLKGTN